MIIEFTNHFKYKCEVSKISSAQMIDLIRYVLQHLREQLKLKNAKFVFENYRKQEFIIRVSGDKNFVLKVKQVAVISGLERVHYYFEHEIKIVKPLNTL